MPNFTAGTSFTDGVTNDVTAAKLNALIADAVPTSSLSLNSTTGTIANFTSSTANITLGTIPTLTSGTTTGTAATFTSGTITTGVIPTLTAGTTIGTSATFTSGTITTGVIPTLTSTTLITSGTGTASAPAIVPTGDTNTGIFFPAADTIAFSEGGTESMRIDSSGRVGIGASPNSSYRMTIKGDSSGVNTGVFFSGASSSFEFSEAGNNTSDVQLWNYQNGYLRFATNNTERIRIDSNGNVGIGTTSPNAKLAIDASGASTPTAPISCNATSGAGDRYAALFRYSGTLSGSVTVNGAAAAYNTSSDYRLKTNLEPISNGIERIKQLPVYRFNWKTNENGNKVDGFVAHEVTPIVREAIHGEKDAVDSDGNPIYQGIDQSKIVPLLTAALKEAIAKIETLESKVTALEAA